MDGSDSHDYSDDENDYGHDPRGFDMGQHWDEDEGTLEPGAQYQRRNDGPTRGDVEDLFETMDVQGEGRDVYGRPMGPKAPYMPGDK
jgi:hypothetical protein